MKTSYGFMLVALLCAAGCDDSDEPRRPDVFDGHVRVTMLYDTVTVLPGDTVTVPGNAVVTDRGHAPVAGTRVNVSVTPANMGLIVYPSPVLQDTTNEAGRVDFNFLSAGPSGHAIITASVAGVSDSCAVHLHESGPNDSSLYLHVSPSRLWLGEGQPDSAFVLISIRDSVSLGVPNVTPILVPDSGGRVGFILPTDSSGRTSAWWWPLCCGSQCIRACHGALSASACVFVDSL